jgi:hypothetical protein
MSSLKKSSPTRYSLAGNLWRGNHHPHFLSRIRGSLAWPARTGLRTKTQEAMGLLSDSKYLKQAKIIFAEVRISTEKITYYRLFSEVVCQVLEAMIISTSPSPSKITCLMLRQENTKLIRQLQKLSRTFVPSSQPITPISR